MTIPATVPATMRAVVARGCGGPEVLQVVQVPVPVPGPGEVLVRVASAGVNRADLMQRAGAYPLPPGSTDVLGLEAAGTVVAVGDAVTSTRPGAEVVALLAGGGQAEYAAVPVEHTAPLPDGVGLVDAGGVVEAAATVWSNLFLPAPPPPGSWVLVHGGSSGIGSLAIQLARAHDLRVATTVGSAEKAAYVRDLGAELVVAHRTEDFAEVLHRHDVRPHTVLDIVGADYLERNVAVLARGGRLAVVGHQSGARGTLPLDLLLRGNLTVTGTGLRARPHAEKAAIVAQLATAVWPLYAAGRLRTTTFARYALNDVAEAHRLLETSGHRGKVLLLP